MHPYRKDCSERDEESLWDRSYSQRDPSLDDLTNRLTHDKSYDDHNPYDSPYHIGELKTKFFELFLEWCEGICSLK